MKLIIFNYVKYWITFVQQPFINKKTTHQMIIMLIVGQISSKEEASEITFIAKLFVVGQRARLLAQEANKKN